MKEEVVSIKNLVCSQVFTWKLECSKAEWDDSDERVVVHLPDGQIPRNIFKQYKNGKPMAAFELSARPGKRKREVVFAFAPETDKKFEHQVSVKVRDECKLLVTAEFTDLFPCDCPTGETQWMALAKDEVNKDDLLSFREILHIEATITILDSSSDRNVSLAPKLFMDNT